MQTSTYSPRAGSKVELAINALRDGPLTTAQLAAVMGCEVGSVDAMMAAARNNGAVIKLKDEAGQLHFGLTAGVIDGRFTPYARNGGGESRNALGRPLTEGPLRRAVESPTETPSPSAIAFANPFKPRRDANEATETEHSDSCSTTASAATAVQKESKKQVAKAAAGELAAALFSNGELHIAVGEDSIRLGVQHTQELLRYLARFQDRE